MRNEEHRVAVFSSALPFGWVTATIGDIIGFDGLFVDGDWVESKDQDPKGDVKLTQLADVGDGVYRNRSNRFLRYEKAVQLGCTFLQPNDLMVARMPDPLGRACIFPGDSKPSVTAVDVCIVRTGLHGADHNWLMYIINSPIFRLAIASLQSGSTRKRISRSNLAKLEFPLPPLPEQHHIVAKIEELFTKLDAGVKALKKIKTQLKRYRQSVLKSAMEGKLTEKWRRTHKDELEPASVLPERIREERKKSEKGKYKELIQIDTSDLPELPGGWCWVTTTDICASVRDGTHDTPKYLPQGIPFITSKNLKEEGLDFSTAKYISIEDHNKFSIRSGVGKGDILFAMIGTIGNPVVVRTNKIFSIKNVALFKKNESIIQSTYLKYWLQNSVFKEILEKKKLLKGTTQKFIPLEHLRVLPVPFTNVNEQHQIVSEIEHRFSIADNVEKVVEQSLKQAERLRRSILKKAFEGKLVPQDSADEPASILLERIKKEKEKLDAERKSKRKSRKKKHKKYVQKGLM